LTWNLFLDDIRNPDYVNDGREYVLARSFDEAVELVKAKGLPSHIAFDHDLGWDQLEPSEGGLILDLGQEAKSGYDFAKWLVECDLDSMLHIQDLTWTIHSSNPVGAANINGLLRNYINQKNNNGL
jgi:hypothetical protein